MRIIHTIVNKYNFNQLDVPKNKPTLLHVIDSLDLDKARHLAEFTHKLELVRDEPLKDDFYLRLDKLGLAVISSLFGPLYISEIYAKLAVRYQNLRNELIIQAVNSPKSFSIWDLTAGLGRDAFILASFGYSVIMVEQNPVLATILHYALENNIIPRRNLNLVYANSLEFIQSQAILPNIIYLDPMFRDNKTAKAKKDMQLIGHLTNNLPDQNQESLFVSSYTKAVNKVVVKRDNKQSNIILAPLPSYTKIGKTIRFDVYVK